MQPTVIQTKFSSASREFSDSHNLKIKRIVVLQVWLNPGVQCSTRTWFLSSCKFLLLSWLHSLISLTLYQKKKVVLVSQHMSFQVQFCFLVAISKTGEFFLLGQLRMYLPISMVKECFNRQICIPCATPGEEHGATSTPTDAHKLRSLFVCGRRSNSPKGNQSFVL